MPGPSRRTGNALPIDLPITPRGSAGLLELADDPSHRLVATNVQIIFEADPEVVREYVPEPLEVDGSGLCYLFAGERFVYTDRHATEFVSPARSAFPECILKVPCRYPGRSENYLYNIFAWTSSDWISYAGR